MSQVVALQRFCKFSIIIEHNACKMIKCDPPLEKMIFMNKYFNLEACSYLNQVVVNKTAKKVRITIQND